MMKPEIKDSGFLMFVNERKRLPSLAIGDQIFYNLKRMCKETDQ